jgi:AcrR family transcriptional regulator
VALRREAGWTAEASVSQPCQDIVAALSFRQERRTVNVAAISQRPLGVVGAWIGVGSYDGGVTEEAGGGPPGRRSYPKGVRRRQQILESAIALFAQRGVDRASLRTVGEAIGVSHAALRHYFSSRDELLVEVYRTHEALAVGHASPAEESAVGVIVEAAERNRSIPGLVELYATLTTDALQERHALTRKFVRDRFRSLRETLAARIEAGQQAGRIAADIDRLDAAALVIAASDGLQIQWLLDPGEVDVGRSLSILERVLPRGPGPGGAA